MYNFDPPLGMPWGGNLSQATHYQPQLPSCNMGIMIVRPSFVVTHMLFSCEQVLKFKPENQTPSFLKLHLCNSAKVLTVKVYNIELNRSTD